MSQFSTLPSSASQLTLACGCPSPGITFSLSHIQRREAELFFTHPFSPFNQILKPFLEPYLQTPFIISLVQSDLHAHA